jgi:site-specific DNA-cytosine methylase
MTALIDRIGDEVDAIDVFCGAGGSSLGAEAAGLEFVAAMTAQVSR